MQRFFFFFCFFCLEACASSTRSLSAAARRSVSATRPGRRRSGRDPPTGADAVIPEPARFGALRLALLRLRARGRLRVEGRVTLGRDVAIRVAEGAGVVLGDGVYLGSGCRLEALDGTLRLGARTLVGPRAFVVSLAGMEVGADCTIGGFAGRRRPGGPGAAPGR